MSPVSERRRKALQSSKFRSRFCLDQADFDYIHERGIGLIESHAKDFIEKRLAPAVIPNDGRQTPFRGHPVFKAQHATATCCRKCLEKWYHIPRDRKLTAKEVKSVIAEISDWILAQMDKGGKGHASGR